ncbi:MAG TPA: hypothetical protein VE243_03220 [Candidatus Acidoferrum sp.]|nr:hypothetical protein [Candidatus Acidoferrum sp.]
MRWPRRAVTASLSVAFATMLGVTGAVVCSGSRALADPSSVGTPDSPPQKNEGSIKRHMREMQQKEFLREHSDASGKPRPDLWREGVEQQKKMQVAPYVGWHASADSAKKSPPTTDK